MKKDWYLLPLISNLLDSPHKACIYTKINLWHAYYLVCIAKGDEWKTILWTHYEAFKWSVISFGLTNALAVFQHFMNNVFSNLLNICIVIYLDNILIYSNDITQHWNHIKEVLKWLWKLGLYAKTEKCEFYLDFVEYLSYVLSLLGLTMSNAKVKTI